jgi:two-component system chemotaxis response regulator CheY
MPDEATPTGARILVIDDDEAVLDSVSQVLAMAGHDVEAASDGEKGLEAYRNNPHDVVIVDIFMPRKSGVEVIQELRSAYPEAKIIVISGGDVRDGLDLQTLVRPYGVQQAIQKPLRIQSVFDAVDRILEQP